jgi:hypothetical protein
MNIPESAQHPGKQYFSPFAIGVLGVLRKLARLKTSINEERAQQSVPADFENAPFG